MSSISALSLPLDDRYAYGDSNAWTAYHAGYTDMAPDASFVDAAGDWSGTHLSYTDPVESYGGTVDDDDDLPDRQAMWAATHPANTAPPADEDMNDALDTSAVQTGAVGVDGGKVSLSLQRGGANALPQGTTMVKVTVPGTDIVEWLVFPDLSPNLDVKLSGVPPGIHNVTVEAFDGTRMVGNGQYTVNVPLPPNAAKPSRQPTPNGTQDVQETTQTPSRPSAPAPRSTPPPPPRTLLDAAPWPSLPPPSTSRAVPDEAESREILAPRPRRSEPAPLRDGIPLESPRRPQASNPAAEVFVAGQAMASGEAVTRPSRTDPEPHRGDVDPMRPIGTSSGAFDTARDGRREGRPHYTPPDEAKQSGSVRRVLTPSASLPRVQAPLDRYVHPEFEGAVDMMTGFQQRDHESVWRGSMKSMAGGVTLGGNMAVSPLLIGIGSLLYAATGGTRTDLIATTSNR